MTEGIYPERPMVAVGAVVIHKGCVLLVLRGKPPALNEWAIPGGSVELGEAMRSAAEREVFEETGIMIRANDLVYTFETIQPDRDGNIRFHYIILDFMAEYISGEPVPRDDVIDARWISATQVSALPVNSKTIELLKKIGFLP